MTHSSEATVATPETERAQSRANSCWSCGASLAPADLFCPACGRIQPVLSAVSYFEVFGLPRKLKLDLAPLEKEFYRLSRRLHPDVYARAAQQEQDWSLANSSLLNDAYRALKDPLRRTEYLLRIEGALSGDEGAEKKEGRAPADLLEEVFELNMQLDEMRMNRQVGESDPQLQKDLMAAKGNFDAQLKHADATLEKLWAKWDAGLDSGNESEKQAAKDELAALLDRRRYIRNLVNSVNDALEG
jgi:molecular chaperone HscB